MSVIPFRPKKVEDEHAPEELGNPLALRGSPQPAPTPETIALARQRQRLRRFVMLVPALLVSAYVIYWALTLWSHKVDDDLSFPTNVRQTWSSPWAGVTASILEREYESNGWAPSAEAWMPDSLPKRRAMLSSTPKKALRSAAKSLAQSSAS